MTEFSLELRRPCVGIFRFDGVDEVDAEIQMHGFVAEDVLELFTNARQPVLAVEREDHHKTAVEKNAFHDDVETGEVFEELLDPFRRVRREALLQNSVGEPHLEGVLVVD